jgi:hypothetical protein
LSVTLWSIAELISRGHVPAKINFSATLTAYSDSPGKDGYVDLFSPADVDGLTAGLPAIPMSHWTRFDHHGLYTDLNFASLNLLLATYFRPTPAISLRAGDFRQSFLQPDKQYVGVCIRGTDKAVEVPHVDSSLYIEQAENLLASGQAERVLIQTDQVQICDLFMGYFRGRCDVIDAIPRTRGTTVVHRSAEVKGSRLDFAKNMIAAVSILSELPHVITHTGNVGAWIALMRGSCENLWQATAKGMIPPPA